MDCGHSRGRRGWDELREQHLNVCVATCGICWWHSHNWATESAHTAGRLKEEGIYVRLWLIRTVVRQKAAQHWIAIILQLKIKKKNRFKWGLLSLTIHHGPDSFFTNLSCRLVALEHEPAVGLGAAAIEAWIQSPCSRRGCLCSSAYSSYSFLWISPDKHLKFHSHGGSRVGKESSFSLILILLRLWFPNPMISRDKEQLKSLFCLIAMPGVFNSSLKQNSILQFGNNS